MIFRGSDFISFCVGDISILFENELSFYRKVRKEAQRKTVNRVLLERILLDIKPNIQDLNNSSDITYDIYRADKRAGVLLSGRGICL